MTDSQARIQKAAAPPGHAAFHLSINNPIVRAILAQLAVALAVALIAW